jgi:hypothetical protein
LPELERLFARNVGSGRGRGVGPSRGARLARGGGRDGEQGRGRVRGDLGGATVGDGRIVIYSNVRHASEALPKARAASAESDASARILKAVRIMVSKLAEKFNRYAA